ncbi:MAG TPA: metallopeptidase family protein [Kiritimatiellia bacterium]|jgi:predicted Zn-dependent protease with MMP-like domain
MNHQEQGRQWQRLVTAAQDEVAALLGALPRELRGEARRVPVSYEPRPSRVMVEDDGIAEDTLGLFVGTAMPDTESGAHDLPAQILLFLENIWEFANHDAKAYREEVRTTFLHELGHYLGLDEDDLTARDLD